MSSRFFCDVCDVQTDESSMAVVRLMYTLRKRTDRNRGYGGSRGFIDLCEACRLLAINNKVGEIISSQVIEKLKQIKAQ